MPLAFHRRIAGILTRVSSLDGGDPGKAAWRDTGGTASSPDPAYVCKGRGADQAAPGPPRAGTVSRPTGGPAPIFGGLVYVDRNSVIALARPTSREWPSHERTNEAP